MVGGAQRLGSQGGAVGPQHDPVVGVGRVKPFLDPRYGQRYGVLGACRVAAVAAECADAGRFVVGRGGCQARAARPGRFTTRCLIVVTPAAIACSTCCPGVVALRPAGVPAGNRPDIGRPRLCSGCSGTIEVKGGAVARSRAVNGGQIKLQQRFDCVSVGRYGRDRAIVIRYLSAVDRRILGGRDIAAVSIGEGRVYHHRVRRRQQPVTRHPHRDKVAATLPPHFVLCCDRLAVGIRRQGRIGIP